MVKRSIIGLSVLLSLWLIPFLYGLTLPEERTYDLKFMVNAPQDLVYDITFDFANQKLWRSDIKKITMGAGGRSWTEHTDHGDLNFYLLESSRPNSFQMTFELEGKFKGDWQGIFTKKGPNKTEFEIIEKVSIHSPFLRAMSKWMKFTEKFIYQYMADLSKEVERRMLLKKIQK